VDYERQSEWPVKEIKFILASIVEQFEKDTESQG
jgi:hypothetical protein